LGSIWDAADTISEVQPARQLSEPAAADRLGIGFGWLQNAWLLHARLKIHRGALIPVCG
jgi:hypothetical protein